MGKTCIGCGKPVGGMLGAFSVKLLYGEVCLTCNKKIDLIENYQFLTPDQVKDVVSGKILPSDAKASTSFASSGTQSKKSSAADEIRQYKELLDEGIITQEEFDAVKKRLLKL